MANEVNEEYIITITDSLGFEHEIRRKFPSKYAAKKAAKRMVDNSETNVDFKVEKV